MHTIEKLDIGDEPHTLLKKLVSLVGDDSFSYKQLRVYSTAKFNTFILRGYIVYVHEKSIDEADIGSKVYCFDNKTVIYGIVMKSYIYGCCNYLLVSYYKDDGTFVKHDVIGYAKDDNDIIYRVSAPDILYLGANISTYIIEKRIMKGQTFELKNIPEIEMEDILGPPRPFIRYPSRIFYCVKEACNPVDSKIISKHFDKYLRTLNNIQNMKYDLTNIYTIYQDHVMYFTEELSFGNLDIGSLIQCVTKTAQRNDLIVGIKRLKYNNSYIYYAVNMEDVKEKKPPKYIEYKFTGETKKFIHHIEILDDVFDSHESVKTSLYKLDNEHDHIPRIQHDFDTRYLEKTLFPILYDNDIEEIEDQKKTNIVGVEDVSPLMYV